MTRRHYAPGQHRFSDEECRVLAQRYLADRTVTQRSLAAELHVCGGTIREALRRGGVDAQYLQGRARAAHSVAYSSRTAIAAARMCELFDVGCTVFEIMADVGYSENGVRKALARHDRRYGHKRSGYTLAKRDSSPACGCGILLAEEPGADGIHCRYCCEEEAESIVPAYMCQGVEDEQAG